MLTGISSSKKPKEIAEVFYKMLKDIPPKLVRTITLDRGKEFAEHSDVTSKLPHVQFFFAHPASPWERGLNENTNGLLRQYVPKHTYKVPFSHDLLLKFTDKLNRRPRKCLNWKSPFEFFFHCSVFNGTIDGVIAYCGPALHFQSAGDLFRRPLLFAQQRRNRFL